VGTWTFWDAITVAQVHTFLSEVLAKARPLDVPYDKYVNNLARDLVFKASSTKKEPNITCIVGVFDRSDVSATPVVMDKDI